MVTTNLSDYTLSFEVNFKNGSSMWGDRPPNISWTLNLTFNNAQNNPHNAPKDIPKMI